MKLIISASIAIFAFCVVQYALAQSHNISWGSIQPGDRLLYRDTIKKSFASLQVVTTDIIFQSYARITYIRANDLYSNNNGGYVTLHKGGVGYNNVTLHLKSQRGHGFNFTVEIYGR